MTETSDSPEPRLWLGESRTGRTLVLHGPSVYDTYSIVGEPSCFIEGHRVTDPRPAVVVSVEPSADEVERAMVAARRTREYRAGAAFDVPSDAVEQYTEGVVRAALAAMRGPAGTSPDGAQG